MEASPDNRAPLLGNNSGALVSGTGWLGLCGREEAVEFLSTITI